MPRFLTPRHLLSGLAALAFATVATVASAQKLAPVPSPSVRVNDNVSLLGAPQEAALDETLADYEKKKGTKIVILTVASTSPEPIDQYGARVAEGWRIGRDGGAGDVLIIIARDNRADQRRIDIEVRGSLRELLPDDALWRIANEDIEPRMQVLDYNGGLVAAIDHVKLLLDGGALPAAANARSSAAAEPVAPPVVGKKEIQWGIFTVLVVGILLFLRASSRHMLYLAGNRTLNRSFSPMIVGSIRGKRVVVAGDDSNGFGGGYVGPGVGGYAGGGGDFGGGGSSATW